ncbi:MAG: FAD-dependent oxidoreductase [Synergistaceae bacterium]|nr:FAD-dependent oxidoreductase [Synergistaceae bacterium]
MSNADYSILFTPLRIGGLTAKNRIMSAPMGAYVDNDGYLTRENSAEYEIRAKGGAAIVNLGETVVCGETGQAHMPMIRMDNTETASSLVPVTEAIHRHGALAGIELLHAGNRANPKYITGDKIYGPCAMERGMYGVPVHELSVGMLEFIAEKFGEAAKLAKFAGVDICMIHGGHGWLLSQFLSPLDNHRTDEFGGSFENRARFPLMVIDSVRKHCGRNYALDFRISGSELADGGVTIDESVALAKLIEDRVDILNVSAGTFHFVKTSLHMFPPALIPSGENVKYAHAIKQAVRIPVGTLGGLGEPELMKEIISSGKADLITLGRPMLADPFLPMKLREGRADEVMRCLRCTECTSSGFVPYVPFALRQLRCAVNPWTGHELDFFTRDDRPASAKKVLVIGGGPAGLQAALSAAEQGHDVTLCEKSPRLGGALLCAEHLPFKKNLIDFVRTMEVRLRNRGVAVKLNTEVTPESAGNMSLDVVIVALGARPFVPPIPGIDSPNVVLAVDVHKSKLDGERVAVIGGGLIGCEEAYHLSTAGKDVTILEMLDDLALGAPFQYRLCMLDYIEKSGVKSELNVNVTRITDRGVGFIAADGASRFIEADHVIVASGLRPLREEAETFRAVAPTCSIVGDCSSSRRIIDAVREGHFAGYYIP